MLRVDLKNKKEKKSHRKEIEGKQCGKNQGKKGRKKRLEDHHLDEYAIDFQAFF